jgi:phosphate/sulfate permease
VKKITLFNLTLSVLIVFLTIIPYTRIFLISYATADLLVFALMGVTIISIIYSLGKKYDKKINLIALAIWFIPILSFVYAIIAYIINPRP